MVSMVWGVNVISIREGMFGCGVVGLDFVLEMDLGGATISPFFPFDLRRAADLKCVLKSPVGGCKTINHAHV